MILWDFISIFLFFRILGSDLCHSLDGIIINNNLAELLCHDLILMKGKVNLKQARKVGCVLTILFIE